MRRTPGGLVLLVVSAMGTVLGVGHCKSQLDGLTVEVEGGPAGSAAPAAGMAQAGLGGATAAPTAEGSDAVMVASDSMLGMPMAGSADGEANAIEELPSGAQSSEALPMDCTGVYELRASVPSDLKRPYRVSAGKQTHAQLTKDAPSDGVGWPCRR